MERFERPTRPKRPTQIGIQLALFEQFTSCLFTNHSSDHTYKITYTRYSLHYTYYTRHTLGHTRQTLGYTYYKLPTCCDLSLFQVFHSFANPFRSFQSFHPFNPCGSFNPFHPFHPFNPFQSFHPFRFTTTNIIHINFHTAHQQYTLEQCTFSIEVSLILANHTPLQFLYD